MAEKNGLGAGMGKGTDYHAAVVIGDTVGDPFKDTSGPASNILIKLMSIISLVLAPSFKNPFALTRQGSQMFDIYLAGEKIIWVLLNRSTPRMISSHR